MLRAMVRVAGVALITAASSPVCAGAGDYMLLVEDASCPSPYRGPSHWERRTSRAFSDEVRRYLTTGRKSGVLRAALVNGHVWFCTRQERRAFEQALVRAGEHQRLPDERLFTDVVGIWGTKTLLAEVDGALARDGLAGPARKRLTKVRRVLAAKLATR